MGNIVQILLLVIAGIVLLWIGYNLFFGKLSPFYPGFSLWKNKKYTGKPGDPMVCPVCRAKLERRDLVKTVAFPTASSFERLVYIRGCPFCLGTDIPRRCPVCRKNLNVDEYLIARMSENIGSKSNLHILGCNHCKKLGSWAKLANKSSLTDNKDKIGTLEEI